MLLADKISKLRIFDDADGRLNLSVKDVGGSIRYFEFYIARRLQKGQSPRLFRPESPDEANRLYMYFAEYMRSLGIHTETGSFGAEMKVSLINDGRSQSNGQFDIEKIRSSYAVTN